MSYSEDDERVERVDAEILSILEGREKKTAKAPRTKKSEPKVKVKKLTKKEQQILEIEQSIVMPENYHLVNTPELLHKLVNYYKTYKTMWAKDAFTYIDTETYGLNNFKDEIITFQIGFGSDEHFFIPLRPFKHESSKDIPYISIPMFVEAFKDLLEADKMLVLANAKFDIHVLYNWCGIDITHNIYWDTNLAGGLLNENHPKGLKEWFNNYALPDMISRGVVSKEEANRPTFKFGSMFDKIPFDEIPYRLAWYYGAHDPYMTKSVFEYQKRIFETPGFGLEHVFKLFREVEMPLIAVFTKSERRGVKLDGDFLKRIVGEELSRKVHILLNGYEDKNGEHVKGIYDYLGDEITLTKSKTRQKKGIKYKEQYEVVEKFNLGSPAQMSKKLYEIHNILEPVMEYDKDLKKEVQKRPTSKKVLTRNKRVHPVIPMILEWRGMTKLIDAFCQSLPDNMVDGRVHASYNQLVKTGRMSCSNPNLQQIPSKFDLIRYGFRADEGRMLVSIDFSQQELRWLAIVTKDNTLIEVFNNGLDMHSRISCQIHGLDYELFEEIRNYKGDSNDETEANIKAAIDKWSGSEEVKYAIQYLNVKEKKNFDAGILTPDLVSTLAAFFDLIRKKTKSVVFGVVYGITEIGLADQIEDTKEEAKKLIDGFKSGLTGYLSWEQSVHRKMMNEGFIETALGRKRRFGEELQEAFADPLWKKRKWHWKVERCKRQSTNAIIQGSSADQVKKALVELNYPKHDDGSYIFDPAEAKALGKQSLLEELDSIALLQVHDEIVFDCPITTPWTDLQRIATVMANVIPNDAGIVFKSDIEACPYWGGKCSPEQIRGIVDGSYDWTKQFEAEVTKKLGIEYEMGTFDLKDEDDDDEEGVA